LIELLRDIVSGQLIASAQDAGENPKTS